MPVNATIETEAAADAETQDLNTRARLLRAATACFARNGYDGTSMREIAAAARVAQQLITYHFGSKEQLWVAVVHSLHDEFLQTMKELRFARDADLLEQFREHQRRVFRDRIDRPYLARIWTQEFLSRGERFERILLPILEEFGEHVSGPYFANVARLGIAAGFTPGETGLICNAILQLSTLNPFFVERSLGVPAESADGIDAQVALLEKIFGNRGAPVTTDGGEQAAANPDRQSEIAELKLAVADLTLENRRLRQSLEAARLESARPEAATGSPARERSTSGDRR